jgi:hypothetical protein
MRQIHIILFCFAMLLFSSSVDAQYYLDYGIKFGASNYVGEIGGKEKQGRPFILDMKPGMTRPQFGGAFVRYRWKENIGLAASLEHARIKGDDAKSTNPERTSRNLSFRNDIIELAGRGEYYFYRENDVGGKGRYQLDFKAFAFIGVSGFFHNPKAYYQDSWVALQPLQTEGVKYSRFQVAVPFGVGFFYTYKREHRIGWEFNVRKTFTDYLDDISDKYVAHPEGSTAAELANRHPGNDKAAIEAIYYGPGSIRGNPKRDDWFMTTSITYSKVIRGKSKFIKKKYSYSKNKKKAIRNTRAKF